MARVRGSSNVNLEGDERLQAALMQMLGDTEDLRPVWPIYHDAFKQAEGAYFASGGDGKWRPLTNRYAAWKRRHGGGDKVLELTGGLLKSFTEDGSRHIYTPSERWARMGTSNPVANIHFSKKGRYRRRPMDVKSPSMQAHMKEAVREHADRYAKEWSAL